MSSDDAAIAAIGSGAAGTVAPDPSSSSSPSTITTSSASSASASPPTPFEGRGPGFSQARLLTEFSKVPVLTLSLRIPQLYILSKDDSERMQSQRSDTVAMKIRIMGEIAANAMPKDGTAEQGLLTAATKPMKPQFRPHASRSVYFVAKDLCTLIHTRKGNVAKSIGGFADSEKARMAVLCPRSNGSVSTHCLTVLSLAGMHRLLNSSRSPLAPAIMDMLYDVVNDAYERSKANKLLASPSSHPSNNTNSAVPSVDDETQVTGPIQHFSLESSSNGIQFVKSKPEDLVATSTPAQPTAVTGKPAASPVPLMASATAAHPSQSSLVVQARPVYHLPPNHSNNDESRRKRRDDDSHLHVVTATASQTSYFADRTNSSSMPPSSSAAGILRPQPQSAQPILSPTPHHHQQQSHQSVQALTQLSPQPLQSISNQFNHFQQLQALLNQQSMLQAHQAHAQAAQQQAQSLQLTQLQQAQLQVMYPQLLLQAQQQAQQAQQRFQQPTNNHTMTQQHNQLNHISNAQTIFGSPPLTPNVSLPVSQSGSLHGTPSQTPLPLILPLNESQAQAQANAAAFLHHHQQQQAHQHQHQQQQQQQYQSLAQSLSSPSPSPSQQLNPGQQPTFFLSQQYNPHQPPS